MIPAPCLQGRDSYRNPQSELKKQLDTCNQGTLKFAVSSSASSSSSSRSSTLRQSDLDLADEYLSDSMTRALIISGRERLVAVESPLTALVDQVPFTSPYVTVSPTTKRLHPS